ncbi:hypothetical protein DY000_02028829 [Brassica cretica]|uniref:Uncharacterized protein n=1 Tax=Brassica cretica TaxID=69181 RepID=A0ABQ7DNS2_BRACR|nr:hypothetical protein DY000_02028829 [Brassica cretica]
MNRGFPRTVAVEEGLRSSHQASKRIPDDHLFKWVEEAMLEELEDALNNGWLEILLWFRRWLTKEDHHLPRGLIDSEPNENAEGELDLRSDAAKDTLWS